MRVLLHCLGLLLIVATVLPFIPTDEKWIRVFDFPRLQIAVLLALTTIGYLFVLRRRRVLDLTLAAALVLALGWQAYHIFPYTPVASVQVQMAQQAEAEACVRIVVANVLMENRNSEDLLELISNAEPDVALLVETDDWWDKALRSLEESYAYSVHQPQDNFYGMILYSRLPIVTSHVEFLIDENIPSIHATLALGSGDEVSFYGVHPVPPPLADTSQRDAELLVVGKLAHESGRPAIVAGDLNDVGWSATTRLFQTISGLVDPRIGRGFYASYHAKYPFMRWPLDYIFHDPSFTLREIRLLEPFGSDHFPILTELCRNPDVAREQALPEADVEEMREANEVIEDGLEAEPGPDEFPKEAD